MPQLDFSTYPSQIFWLFIFFTIFYVIIAKAILPNIREVLYNRNTRIAENIRKAEELNKQASQSEIDFNNALRESKNKALDIMSQAREQISKEIKEKNEALDAKFKKQEQESVNRIELVKANAGSELKPVINDLVNDIYSKVTGENIEDKKIAKFVENF